MTPPEENVKKRYQKNRYYEYSGNSYYLISHGVLLLLAPAWEKRTGSRPV